MWREEGARLLHTQPTTITPNINLTLLNCLFRYEMTHLAV